MKTDADGAIEAIYTRPMDFIEDTVKLTDTKTSITYWTGNGLSFCGVYSPSEYGFSWFGKFKFWIALKWWRRQWLIEQNKKALEK